LIIFILDAVLLSIDARGLGDVAEVSQLAVKGFKGVVDELPEAEANFFDFLPDDGVDNGAGAQLIKLLGNELPVDGGLSLDIDLLVVIKDIFNPALDVVLNGRPIHFGVESLGEGVVIYLLLPVGLDIRVAFL
jgi:hypothetical protein